MKDSIHKVISRSIRSYCESPRESWVMKWPGQAILCISQTYWTADIHQAIKNGLEALDKYLEQNNRQIEKVVTLVKGNFPQQTRITLGCLVVLDVHARDVLATLIENKVSSENDFIWLSQLRYYWQVRALHISN
ncbi:dynein axonemal heavy chain 12-like isoform X1 [Tachypleus tridentatus]|uniref:dynein axonemal heavy chain 12-like isoform X1 n=1 Tax=Tachypleus tridentatus TaxID=6853 RepID=UPI003FD02079